MGWQDPEIDRQAPDWVEPSALADSPPDGRTIIDPPPAPRMNPGGYGQPKPTVTQGLCGWDDMGTPIE